jgi:hypothetical protein
MEFDLRKLGVDEVNRLLRELPPGKDEIVVHHASSDDLVGLGLQNAIQVRFEGSLGDYCFAANEKADLQVIGSVEASVAMPVMRSAHLDKVDWWPSTARLPIDVP